MAHHLGRREFRRVPGHIEEEGYRVFHRLEVADIENPQAVDTVVIGQAHLLAEILRRGDVEPLGVARSADIVDVVIHSPASRVLALLGVGEFADIAPVVVADEHNHIVGHTQAEVIISLHLFIYGPYLLTLLGLMAGHILDNLTLVLEDFAQKVHIVFVARHIVVVIALFATHRGVAVAAHADCNQVLRTGGTFNALTEKSVDDLPGLTHSPIYRIYRGCGPTPGGCGP